MFLVSSLLTSIALLGVVHAWATSAFPALARRRRIVGGALVGLVLLQLFARWAVMNRHALGGLNTVLIVLIMTLMMAAVPIGLMHGIAALGAWVARRRAAGKAPTEVPPTGGPRMSRRQVVEAT